MTIDFRASVYIAVTVDGFIARLDGSLDWLPGADGQPVVSDPPYEGDYGYGEFLQSVDALVMGRATYDAVLGMGRWFYGDTPVVVLTHRPIEPPDDPAAVVSTVAGDPHAVAVQLAADGIHHVYVDGGRTIQQFLNAGLVDRLVLTRVPVLLGDGIPLFGPLPNDLTLRHEATEAFPTGLVQTTYDLR